MRNKIENEEEKEKKKGAKYKMKATKSAKFTFCIWRMDSNAKYECNPSRNGRNPAQAT